MTKKKYLKLRKRTSSFTRGKKSHDPAKERHKNEFTVDTRGDTYQYLGFLSNKDRTPKIRKLRPKNRWIRDFERFWTESFNFQAKKTIGRTEFICELQYLHWEGISSKTYEEKVHLANILKQNLISNT